MNKMNIYNARKIQKELYKLANKDYRIQREYLWKGQLLYQVIHKMWDADQITFRGDDNQSHQTITRLEQNMKAGVITTFTYLNRTNLIGAPSGMYVLEAIPVD